MPKLIFKSNYIKAGKAAAGHRSNLVHYMATRDGVKYLDYIANRKGVEVVSQHGLFSNESKPIVLSQVMTTIANHEGNLWMPIFSLTREDAEATGFNNADTWKNLLSKLAPELARSYKIDLNHFHWYAAYHDHEEHPHCHMVLFSDNPNEGYLTKSAIEQIKSRVVKEIFAQQMLPIYQDQTHLRQQVKQQFDQALTDLSDTASPQLTLQLQSFSKQLHSHKGKKSYGYLSKQNKRQVDTLVDEIGQLPSVKAAYLAWLELANLVQHNYTDQQRSAKLLSQEKEFRSIKNMVINFADEMDQSQTVQPVDMRKTIGGLLEGVARLFDQQQQKLYPQKQQHIDRKRLQQLATQGKLKQHQQLDTHTGMAF